MRLVVSYTYVFYKLMYNLLLNIYKFYNIKYNFIKTKGNTKIFILNHNKIQIKKLP